MVINFRSYILAVSSKFLRLTLLKKYIYTYIYTHIYIYALSLVTSIRKNMLNQNGIQSNFLQGKNDFTTVKNLGKVWRYNMVGEVYRTVLSYGSGLCIATWVGLWRDLGLKYSDPFIIPKRKQDSGRWLRSLTKVIEILTTKSWLEIPSLDSSLFTGQSLDLVHRKIRGKILWLSSSERVNS